MVGWRRLPAWLVACVLGASLVGCSGSKPSDHDLGFDNPSNDPPLPDPLEASTIEDDGGVFGLGGRENDGGIQPRPDDAGSAPADAAPAQPCTGPIGPGDVKIVELMIASASGIGDRGEWVELVNTRSCTLDASGLVVESPRGTTGKDSATIPQGVLVAPGAALVVADSADGQSNHGLPGVAAAFNAYDVLKNDGDTVSVYAGATLIDSLTYPKFTLEYGRSVAFPSDCAWSDRADWARWSFSFHVWSSPYQGTPGADNSDVTCY